MAIHVLSSPIITLSSRDLTDHIESAEVSVGIGNAAFTAFTNTWEQNLPNGIKRWSVRLNFFQDYATSYVYDVLEEILAGSTAVPFTARPTTSTQSATNPTFSGNVILDGDFNLMGGAVGEAHKTSVTLKGSDTLNFLTSSTS